MTKKQLKQVRKYLKLTQEEAAEFYGTTLGAWRNWEQGRRPIPQWLKRLLSAYKITGRGK